MTDQKLDRLVSLSSVLLVDLSRQGFGLLLQLPVIRELAAGWSRHLDECEIPLPLGMLGEQRVDRLHAIENAFRVVEPLDADTDAHFLGQTEALPHGPA